MNAPSRPVSVSERSLLLTNSSRASRRTRQRRPIFTRKTPLPAPAVDRYRFHAKVFGDLLRTEQLPQPLLLHTPLSLTIVNPVILHPYDKVLQCVLPHLSDLGIMFLYLSVLQGFREEVDERNV
jgi:hypothetical protein